MIPAVYMKVCRNGSAAGWKASEAPLGDVADLGRLLHLPSGFTAVQGETPDLISRNARLPG
jgi:hypothetical protein